MAVCARAVAQPDGSFLLGLDPSVTDLSTCAYSVETGGSNGWRELGNMTMADAGVIGTSVGLLWAGAWCVRQVVRVLHDVGSTDI